jgi:multisubunit Na+/H+ antiporter MnhC subunit
VTLRPSLQGPQPADGGPPVVAPRAPRVVGAIGLLPTALAVIAEAAWVAIVAGLLQAFTRHPPVLGYPWFLAAAVAGLIAARLLEPRAGGSWPALVAVLAILTGMLGWLLAPEVRAILAADGLDGLGRAIAANIGGWLGAVAFVRGVAYARLPADPRRIGNVLGLAVPGLAAVALIGGMVGEPFRGAFLGEAQAQVILFLLAAITALALSRLGLVATGAAVDWRRNPAWLVLLLVLLAITALLAIATSLFAGEAIVTIVTAILTPLLIVGFFVGFDRRSIKILLLSVGAAAGVVAFLQLFAGSSSQQPPGAAPSGVPLPPEENAAVPVAFGVLAILLAVAVIAILVLARLWLRHTRNDDDEVPETREIDKGDREIGRARARRRGRFLRRPVPRDAAGAYRMLLEDLGAHPELRREDGETPVEHAARLRASGHGRLALELLAADYGLARFGGVVVSERETRRAIARARSLARDLPRSLER